MTDRNARLLVLFAAFACAGACASAPAIAPPPASRQTAQESRGTRYLLHRPAAYELRSDWPVILFLHGAGERGRDLEIVKREGLPHILETLPDFPFVVVSPQEEKGRLWTADELAALVDEVVARDRVDAGRIYVSGLSSGATAALALAIHHPEKVAAAVAVSVSDVPPELCAMKDVPVWILHNAGDERVPAARAKKLARELERCGGREVKLTVYPREGHDAWTETYRRQDLYDWMLLHRNPSPSSSGRGPG
jgi:predicted peptidase